jgi:16S rRNA processing protein RimM
VSDRLVAVGKVVATHGIGGWLRLKLYNPQTSILSRTRRLFVQKNSVTSGYAVDTHRPHRGLALVKLAGVDHIAAAEELVGAEVYAAEETLEPLQPGEYYQYQVVGFDVFDVSGRVIGKVARVWIKPGGDLFVVVGPDKTHLIPAVKEIIRTVDLNGGKIIIDPPAGLLDL